MRFGVCLLVVTLAGLPLGAVKAQSETVAIVAPIDGQTVAGLVSIVGVAGSPQLQRYEVEFGYEPNPTDTWFPLQDPVLTPQPGGTLAQWDTVGLGIADGAYVIRLRLYRTDGSFAEALAHNVALRNGTSPFAVTGVPAQPPTAAPTVTATGVVVDLPPTSTPRPTATPFPAGAPARPALGVAGPTFDRPSFERAFLSGIGWAAAVFVLIGLYAALRPRVRPYLWRLMRRLVKSR